MHSNNPHFPVLAYEDESFLDSEDGRPVRILAEYLGPLHRFRLTNINDTIVFLRLGAAARRRPARPLLS